MMLKFVIILISIYFISISIQQNPQPTIKPNFFDQLKEFYDSTGGPYWTTQCKLNSTGCWLQNETDYCQWYGVSCGLANTIELNLPNNNLSGTLPESLWTIPLYSLRVQFNQLFGTLSKSMMSVEDLEEVDISHNQLTGNLPCAVNSTLSFLDTFDASDNNFSGPLDPSWGQLPALRLLTLSRNSLSGTMPPFSNALLNALKLSHNDFVEPIPDLTALSSLVFLELSHNFFSGSLPDSLASIPQLRQLLLEHNNFSGAIPSTWYNPSTPLAVIDLNYNNISSLDLQALASLLQGYSLVQLTLFGNDDLVCTDPNCFSLWQPYTAESIPIKDLHYSCAELQYVAFPYVSVRLPVQYLNYTNCRCDLGFYGSPPVCVACPDMGVCDSGDYVEFPVGFWPEFSGGDAEPSENGTSEIYSGTLLGFVECESDACNPEGECMIFGNGTISGCENFCEEGYENRLCSLCVCNEHECYFHEDGECLMCESGSTTIEVILLFALCIVFIAILVVRRASILMVLLEGTFVVFVVAIGLAEWWQADVIVILVIVHIVSYIKSQRTSNVAEYLSVSGVGKIALFFVQTNFIINIRFWRSSNIPDFLEHLNFIQIHVSGLECVDQFRSVTTDPLLRFLTMMAIPFILTLCYCFILLFRKIIGWIMDRLKSMWKSMFRSATKHAHHPMVDSRSFHNSITQTQTYTPSQPIFNTYATINSNIEENEQEDILEQAKQLLEKQGISTTHEIDGKHIHQHDPAAHESHGHHAEHEASFFVSIAGVWVLVFYMSYFELSERIFSTMACAEDELSGRHYVAEIPWIDCSTELYNQLYVACLVFISLYIVGFPLLLAVLLYKFRHQLESHTAEHVVGFIHENFRHKYFWYELTWMARRIALAAAVSLSTSSLQREVFLVVLILLISVTVQQHIQPFKHMTENTLDTLSLGCLVVTYSYGLAQYSDFSSRFFDVLVAVLNIGMAILLALALMASIFRNATHKILARFISHEMVDTRPELEVKEKELAEKKMELSVKNKEIEQLRHSFNEFRQRHSHLSVGLDSGVLQSNNFPNLSNLNNNNSNNNIHSTNSNIDGKKEF